MSSQRARAHANRAYFCTCGKVVHGNGGKAGHAYMHATKGDGHHYMAREAFIEKFRQDVDRGASA